MTASLTQIACIAAGGSAGAVLRYLATVICANIIPGFPLGIAIVNAIGSFAAGAMLVLLPSSMLSLNWFVLVGFLGALTTMSSFSVEFALLLEKGRYLGAAMHWFLGAICCCGLGILGMWVGQRIGGV